MGTKHSFLSSKLRSDGFWSFFGTTVSVLSGLVIVKVITSLVAAVDYGEASLVLGIVALLNGILVGPLMQAHIRIYFDYLERGMGHWFANVFNRVFGAAALIAVGLYLLVATLFALAGKTIYLKLSMPVILVVIAQPYLSALTNYLEAHRSHRRLAIVNILHKVFQPLVLVLLLAFAFPQAAAVIISQGLAILIILSIFRPPQEQKESDNVPQHRETELAAVKTSIFGFGWALPLGYIVMWGMTTSDRYIIEYFQGIQAVGIYAINYGFWSIPYLMLNGWLEIWTRPVIYNKSAKADWVGVRRIILLRTLFGLSASVIGTVILFLAGESIAKVMLGREYWVARDLMLIIAAAHCFFVIGYSVLPIFMAGKKPKAILVATCLGAISNITLNFIIIPVYGMRGAAISTLASYFIWATMLSIWAYLYIRDLTSDEILVLEKEAT